MIIVKIRMRTICTKPKKFPYKSSKISVRFRFSHEFWIIEGLSKIFGALRRATFSFRPYSQRKYPRLRMLAMNHFQCKHFGKSRPAGREDKKGARGADWPRASYSEGPQIVRALFLRNPQNALMALIPWTKLFLAHRPYCEGWGASLWMTTLSRPPIASLQAWWEAQTAYLASAL